MDAQRALLDTLMGKTRNLTQEERTGVERKWDDSDVCPYFLCGFCPNELFTNTKSDLGGCNKEHDEFLRRSFMAEPAKKRLSYETRFMRELERLVADCDSKIKKGEERLALQYDPLKDRGRELTDEERKRKKEKEEKISEINDNIKALQKQFTVESCEPNVMFISTLFR